MPLMATIGFVFEIFDSTIVKKVYQQGLSNLERCLTPLFKRPTSNSFLIPYEILSALS